MLLNALTENNGLHSEVTTDISKGINLFFLYIGDRTDVFYYYQKSKVLFILVQICNIDLLILITAATSVKCCTHDY